MDAEAKSFTDEYKKNDTYVLVGNTIPPFS